MALKNYVLLVLILSSVSNGELYNQPFPNDYSMGTLGTVINKKYSNIFTPDTLKRSYQRTRMHTSVSYVSYYDRMDNLTDEKIYQISLNGYLRIKNVTVALCASQLNAFDCYFEKYGSMSLSVELLGRFCTSVNVSALRNDIKAGEEDYHTSAVMDFEIVSRIRRLIVIAEVSNVCIMGTATSGILPDIKYKAGIQTPQGKFGSQAFVLEVNPKSEAPLRWKLGEEIYLTKSFGLQIAIANNPVQIGAGVIVTIRSLRSNVSIVNNEALGWSRGVCFGWERE